MAHRNKLKTTLISALLIALVAIVGSAVATFAWFSNQADEEVIYEIPTNSSLIIQFDSVVTKDVQGTLYPAVVDADAVADNQWNNPDRIVKEAGRVTYNAQFTLYGGTAADGTVNPQTEKRLVISSAAVIANVVNSRDLVKSKELETEFVFTVAGESTQIKYSSALGKVEYIGGTVGNSKLSIDQGGFLVILTDTPISVAATVYLTTPDVITAKDLSGENIRVALTVKSPDVKEEP